MHEKLELAAKMLTEKFSAEPQEFRGDTVLIVLPDHLIPACQLLRDEFGFNLLEGETAVDYWPEQEPRFHLVYQLYSIRDAIRIALRVPLSNASPVIATLEGIYPNANWYEREIWDMFGIKFEGHSDLRRILMPYEWEGHPLRKDYPLGYEEVQFTFNAHEIDQHKTYSKD
jgi:NADH-quinone oxidoreductase subunit C